MAISFIGVSSVANGLVGGNAVALTTPGGTANGDMMLAHVCIGATGRAITAPAGWAQLVVAVNESDHTQRTYWKIASAEPGSRSWTVSGAATAFTGMLTVHRGTSVVHGASNVDALALLIHPGPGLTVNSTGAWLQASSSGMSLLALGWGAPAGMTERADVIGGLLVLLNVNSAVFDQGPVTAGMHNRSSVSLDLVAAINFLIALEPDQDIIFTGSPHFYRTPFPGLFGGFGIFAEDTIGPGQDVQYALDDAGFILFNTLLSLPLAPGGSCC